jgi:3-hydroxymyristoyl/3-hydroxydecanoyl-(acyl carrier protein) dehydratase
VSVGAGRYAAFTFVDRITDLVRGRSARGTFHIPATMAGFPSSLLAEATGQLAAWVAVDQLGFRLRPVAGIAHETEYRAAPQPGDTLETEVRIDSCEEDAVAYQGWARIGGRTVMELRDCVGPMLPLREFDDPEAMQAFFATLCTTGARVDRFPGLDAVRLEPREAPAKRSRAARLHVPGEAAFFDDHFPRRPVFPGTLLLDRMTTLAAELVAESVGGQPFARLVTDVKLRAFTEPGSVLELSASLDDNGDDDAPVALLEARAEGQRRPVGSARVTFEVKR